MSRFNAPMSNLVFKIFALLILVLANMALLASSAQAKGYSRQCLHPDEGNKWGYGSAKLGCDADQYGDISRIHRIYPEFLFDSAYINDPDHRDNYITNVAALVQQEALDFYKEVMPKAGPAERTAWVRAILSIAAHETHMTHYRIGFDRRDKLMSGDHNRSLGMMQINMSFQANRARDPGFDLAQNLRASMENYFKNWMNALSSSCYIKRSKGKHALTGDPLLEARAQGAYSAYNGGGGKICRYANPKDPYAAADKHFKAMYDHRDWLVYVVDKNRKIGLNTRCLMDGDDVCGTARPPQAGDSITGRPLVYGNGMTCVTSDGKNFDCAEELRTFACFKDYSGTMLSNTPIVMPTKKPDGTINVFKARGATCKSNVPNLAIVGDSITLKKPLQVRDSVAVGRVVGKAEVDHKYQVLDFDVRFGDKGARYYKIRISKKIDGWVYGGGTEDYDSYASVEVDQDGEQKGALNSRPVEPILGTNMNSWHGGSPALSDTKPVSTSKSDDVASTPPALPGPVESIPVPKPKPAQFKDVANNDAHTFAIERKKIKLKPQTIPTVEVTEEDLQPEEPTVDYPIPFAPAKKANTVGENVLPKKFSLVEIQPSIGIKFLASAGEKAQVLGVVPEGVVLMVREKPVQMGAANLLYLPVSYNGKAGFIYAGHTAPKVTLNTWVKVVRW